MTLPNTPPKYATWKEMTSSIAEGESGWRVFALQTVLNSVRYAEPTALWPRLTADGVFKEDGTLSAVLAYQKWARLVQDGLVGPTTQGYLVEWAADRVHDVLPEVPDGLMKGYVIGEGARLLAATNWAIEDGVDCGPGQLRVYGPPYAMNSTSGVVGMTLAFNPVRALVESGNDFLSRAEVFYDSDWVRRQGARREEFAKRCAVMAHNWPTQGGADRIAMYGKCSNPDGKCTWVPRNSDGTSKVLFPDGVRVESRWQWCQFYAMGAPEHDWNGNITKYVVSWQ